MFVFSRILLEGMFISYFEGNKIVVTFRDVSVTVLVPTKRLKIEISKQKPTSSPIILFSRGRLVFVHGVDSEIGQLHDPHKVK